MAPYAQIVHDRPAVKRSYFNVDSYSFTGPALYDGKKYEKLKITNKEDASLNREITGGWLASLEHHFVVAIVPARDQTHHFTLRVRGDEYLASRSRPGGHGCAGQQRPRSSRRCSSARSCRHSSNPSIRNSAAPPTSAC